MPQARCPLCDKRPAGRDCPAKGAKICSVCCGTKREIEIDCPSDCPHLASGHAWEAGRAAVPPVASPSSRFGEQFLNRHGAAISAMAAAVLEERAASPSLVDAEVRSALEALRATLKTLDSGLYYETQPEGSFQATALYRRMRAVLEDWMRPESPDQPALKVSEAGAVLDFLMATLEARGSDRPRSRRYLDWLSGVIPQKPESSGPLIVP